MTTRGVEGVYVETHSWGKTAKFLESLGFKVEFATEHGSGMLKNDDGPYFVVGEIPEDRKPQTQLILRVEDAETFKPDPIVEVVSPFEETHYGTQRMVVRDPDGREWSIEAPLKS
ncbi:MULTISPECIES: VOC family protein [unclassified Streptomyces]|uniref:VOC family protein n=1 Tax=unclassified Streptomyces TaxID=2593676 RepID=UPI002E0E4283|nr:VOC family protein [Streptomyces sp. NBC_01197]WSS51414.1 VOC family protein [Streptomyces sp. NBC_01180]